MFQGKIKADFMKLITNAIEILVDEAKIKIKEDGIYGRMVDPAHVGMIDFKIEKDAFDEYKLDDEEEIAFDLEKLSGILKIAGSNDMVEIKYGKEEARLIIRIGNITKKIGLLDASEMPDTKVPSLELPAEIVAPTEKLYQTIRCTEGISDHIILEGDKDYFEMRAEGDNDSVELRLSKEELISIKCNDKVKSMFPIDYLGDMIKIAKDASQEAKIYLGNNYPVKIYFEALGVIKITYLLAPRIESD
ncbi:MAG: DNA polymerase sliding clamp [Thermoplasmatales archaeon]|nr:DNA polymerase sliding clamp [Thermoplasmatales archaeon]